MRNNKEMGRLITPFILLLLAIAAAGCSSATREGTAIFDSESGRHPAGWITGHSSIAVLDQGECTSCHSDTLNGGISGVSCLTSECHHTPTPNWSLPIGHGASAKRAPGNSSFISCQICHGDDFTGGLSGQDCFSCHPNSPHPSDWLPGDTFVHINTAPQNATVCVQCHTGGENSPIEPPPPPPPGTEPGCFNNTLCHGALATHILGPEWRDPDVGGSNFHGLTAKEDLVFCQNCHGTPGTTRFDGGVTSTGCAASTCHPQAKAHPIRWFAVPEVGFPPYTPSHRDSDNRDKACGICHRVDEAGPGPEPGAPSCFSDSFNGVFCHSNGPGRPNHNIPFLDHEDEALESFSDNCSNCHAISGTSPVIGAPTCTTCHQTGSPLTFTVCTSCHGDPPDSVTGPYPNFSGAHVSHLILDTTPVNPSGTPVSCDTCHSGLESGTQGHYDRANGRPGGLRGEPGDVIFNSLYNGADGAASFDDGLASLRCSNVRCHGGQTTPNWRTGSIDSFTDRGDSSDGCRRCHTPGSGEPSSPDSGRHQKHLDDLGSRGNALCTECHNMLNGTEGALNHFAFLRTDELEGPPGDTVEPNDENSSVPRGTYDSREKTCTVTCHGVRHVNFPWEGDAGFHTIPFLNSRHISDSRQEFSSDCDVCHDLAPTDPNSFPPTCTTCHQNGSPLGFTECTSCHGEPPNGSAYPNIAGRHGIHVGLQSSGTPISCDTCHSGLDSGTQAHYNRANARSGENALRVPPGDVAFLSTYNSRTGASSFNSSSLTCFNVSCHGGQTTPNWRTGSIDVNRECEECHAFGTSQFNSYSSGEHGEHVFDEIPEEFPGINPTCIACHNTSSLAATHFNDLSTPAMGGAPSTIGGGNTEVISYSPGSQSCTPTCHERENWRDDDD